jgi:hypothetical protein
MTAPPDAGPRILDLWNPVVDLCGHEADFARALDLFWRAFVDPETGIVYDAPMDRPEVWPTPEEVAAGVPTINGWDTAIENAPGEGGPLLAGLALDAFAIPDERRRERMDLLFRGLVGLWDMPGRTGFVCRGFLRDRRSFYVQTSWDQVPPYLAGLWLYGRSRHCREAHRRVIAEVFESVLRWLEAHGWAITLHDGRPAVHGGMADVADPGIARLMALLLMGGEVTGDARWAEAYRGLRDADGRKRWDWIASREKVYSPYAAFYQAFFLWALEQLDGEEESKAFYARERRHFLIYLASSCVSHIYPRLTPIGRSEGKTINVREDRLIDWRPAWRAAKDDPMAGDPEKPRFWYNYRTRLEQMRADAGLLHDGWLTCDMFSLFGVFALVQGHRQSWAYATPAACLRAFFSRLSYDRPLRFLSKLAFALGMRNAMTGAVALRDSGTPPR